jgi:hypothetical protein
VRLATFFLELASGLEVSVNWKDVTEPTPPLSTAIGAGRIAGIIEVLAGAAAM